MIILIGAGVVGLSIAWRLAEDGAQVTLFDPQPGLGATQAAAGMLAPVSEYWFQEEPLLDLARHAAEAYPAVCGRLSALTGIDLHYRQDGTIVAAATRADRETLTRLQHAQVRHGLSVTSLSTREARHFEPALAPRLAGAFLSRADHALDPRALTEAYLQALESHPHVTLHRSRAVALIRHGDRVSGVRDASGTKYVGDAVVLANGVATSEIEGLPQQWEPRLRPVYGETIRLQAPPTSARSSALLGPRHVVRALVEDRSVYVVPRGDGQYVLGATEREDHQAASPAGSVYRLLRDAHRVLPDILEMQISEIVARARPATPDHLPLLGTISPGLVVASGTYRHGVLLAPAIAETVSHLVQHKPAPISLQAFDPWRSSQEATPTHDPHVPIGKENFHDKTQRRTLIDYS